MRIVLLTLLLIVYVEGSIFDSFKGIFSGSASFGQKLKNATFVEFRKLFSNTTLFKIRDRFRSMKDKVVMTLKQASVKAKALLQKIKEIRPIKNDKISEMGDNIEQINKNSKVDKVLYQGDVVLTEEQAVDIIKGIEDQFNGGNRTKRQAYKDYKYPGTIWSKGVNYYFHESANETMRRVFVKAAKQWEENSCINFVENQNASDRIMVFQSEGCWSFFGKLGGEQKLSLGKGCDTIATAAHEIGHALGFFHTMSRHDRDEYIVLDLHNIEPDWLIPFHKESVWSNDNYDMEYDYGSIMHYGTSCATVNGKPTMVPYDLKYQQTLGSPFISFTDISMINEHYNCKEECDPANSAKCEMGGFPHPRNCSKCICPGGYSGDLCTERPSGCGRTVQASLEWQPITDTMGVKYSQREDYTICNYWIESAPGTEIEVKLLDYSIGVSTEGCRYAGVEIKTNKDQTLTGYRAKATGCHRFTGLGENTYVPTYTQRRDTPFLRQSWNCGLSTRFCSPQAIGTTLRSHTNRVPIITYNRYDETRTIIVFRQVPADRDGSGFETNTAWPTDTRTGLGEGPDPESSSSQSSFTTPAGPSSPHNEKGPEPQLTTTTATQSPSPMDGIICKDNKLCPRLVQTGFCKGNVEATKIKMCPKSCGYC